jgi:DNA-binding IclR family transcriptional regulator
VGSEVVYIDKVEGNRAVRISSQIGGRRPIYSTALGKSIMAHLPEDTREEILPQIKFKALTSHTITNLDELRRHLRETAQRGYSLDLEESEVGLSCVAAPLRNHLKETVAAISVAMPTARFQEHGIASLSAKVMDIAAQISRQLGCPL